MTNAAEKERKREAEYEKHRRRWKKHERKMRYPHPWSYITRPLRHWLYLLVNAIHERRLGKAEHKRIGFDWLLIGLYLSKYEEREREKYEGTASLRGDFEKVRLRLWVWYMRFIGFFLMHEKAFALLESERAREVREAEKARKREEEAQRRAEEERKRKEREERRRQEEAKEKARREKERREREQREKERREWERNMTDYDKAVAFLGLGEHFGYIEFKKAYRRAMMRAHPDRGGHKLDAQAVNKARDTINRRKGWR